MPLFLNFSVTRHSTAPLTCRRGCPLWYTARSPTPPQPYTTTSITTTTTSTLNFDAPSHPCCALRRRCAPSPGASPLDRDALPSCAALLPCGYPNLPGVPDPDAAVLYQRLPPAHSVPFIHFPALPCTLMWTLSLHHEVATEMAAWSSTRAAGGAASTAYGRCNGGRAAARPRTPGA